MIAEAVDTVVTLGWAFAVWIVLCALAVALAVHTVIAVAWWTARAMRRLTGPRKALSGPLADERPVDAPRLPRDAHSTPEAPSRPAPSWAPNDKEPA